MKKLATFLITVPIVSILALRLAAALLGQPTIRALAQDVGPLAVVVILAVGFAVSSYVLGLVTGDLSWVDRMWSTVPILYGWIYAHMSGYDMRTTVVAILISLWGLRLTYNFARRGGYTFWEDYRWGILKRRIKSPVLWQAFSLLFISSFQNSLFVLFTLPCHALYLEAGGSAGIPFWAGAALMMGFLAYETIADQQQWDFQNAKTAAKDTGEAGGEHAEDIERGFRTSGLFRISRHPNYFGELMVWWMVYQMATTAVNDAVHWSGLGGLLLTVLFVGSTAFTESITRAKYPDYDAYRAVTSAIIPLPPRGDLGEARTESANT